MDMRYIEYFLPIKEISAEAAREKNTRQGSISNLHIWWARRPLASSRATNYASLISLPKSNEKLNEIKDFIIKLCKRENSINNNIISKARREISNFFRVDSPKILDPFCGGGSIPLEALRLGCETYASDYNPIAVIISKCILEFPEKYGESLIKEINKWGKIIYEELKSELIRFYPNFKVNSKGYFSDVTENLKPVFYIWTRVIKCSDATCGCEIPLFKRFWLVKKGEKKISLFPYLQNKIIKFKIVGEGYGKIPKDFDPNLGTLLRAKGQCLKCGRTIEAKEIKEQINNKKADHRLIVIVFKGSKREKIYKIATEKDFEVYKKAEEFLEKEKKILFEKWGIDPIPNEETPYGKGRGAERAFSLRNYNLNTWGDLFNSRQKLIIVMFLDKIKEAYKEMISADYNDNFAKTIITYLALQLGRLENWNSILSRWRPDQERNESLFSRAAISIVLDYAERNPFIGMLLKYKTINEVIDFCTKTSKNSAKVIQCSATELPYEENFFDAIFTDPPYYDNIPYSHLSDFFYVWLKRILGDIYPNLFSTPLTPKIKEIVAYTHNKSWEEAKNYFEDMLKKAFKEMCRVLKPKGIAVIVYAHKTTEGWESIINALLDSGLTITASWPISTEMKTRLRAKESAALASSIYIVARKIEKKEVCFYSELRKEMKSYLYEKLEFLWNEGFSGGDFFIAAIGAGIEVFGKYEKIIDYEDNIIKADKLLEEIREITTNFAVEQILHDGFSEEISPLTRFYVLWRWNYSEAKVPFDEARKLAQSIGISLDQEWNKGFIRKEKQFIRVLGPKDRDIRELKSSKELVDILHYILLLWEKGESEKKNLLDILSSSYGRSDVFYRVAQAISQTLNDKSKEKQLIDGFLSIKEKLKEKLKPSSITQKKLDKFFG